MSQKPQEKILVLESSLEDRDLIARQALRPLGFDVKTAELVSSGIQLALTFQPDLIITNLALPDLSGKDLLVALQAQKIDTPVVLVANEGQEQDVIQAFRLGATDVIKKPLREAEVVAIVERALQAVRNRRERDQLSKRLQASNDTLERRIRDLNTLIAIGKAATSTMETSELFKILVDGAARLTGGHRTYFLTRVDQQHYHLAAYHNLPRSLAGFLNRPFDDGISSLIAVSGKSLKIHGEPLERFKISRLGKAALIVPVRARREIIGMLVSIRTVDDPFRRAEQELLEAVADYAAISLMNVRLFKALEEKAEKMQEAPKGSRTTTGANPN